MAAAGGVAGVLPVDVDEEVAGLLCEAAVELDIAAGASPVMAVCTALRPEPPMWSGWVARASASRQLI
jgi:hypothetical protein